MPSRFGLSGKPKLSLVRSRSLLAQFASAEELDHLYLGGGTALSMRWAHRHSTDIDFAMPMPMGEEFVRKHGQAVNGALAQLRENGTIKKQYFFAGRTGAWTFPDSGPVSLSVSPSRFDPITLDREEQTDTPMIPAYDILKGKLLGRAIDGGKLLARDGYDLACAFLYDRSTIESLVRETWATRSAELVELCEMVKASSRRIIVGRPLLQPAHREHAHDPWSHFVAQAEALSPDSPNPPTTHGPRLRQP